MFRYSNICLFKRLELQDFFYYVLGMTNSNLVNGHIYFYCFPNFSINLNDPSILLCLSLNIKTKYELQQ